MIGDYSSINDHLESARRLADSAETKADPAIYREAIDRTGSRDTAVDA